MMRLTDFQQNQRHEYKAEKKNTAALQRKLSTYFVSRDQEAEVAVDDLIT